MRGRLWSVCVVLTLITGRIQPAWSVDYQFHGYADQGLLWSSDNNYFGHSTIGSLDYYELGLNGTVALRPNLLMSAQGAVRSAGATDAGRPRLDYALADYRFLNVERYSAGVRAGKVKNPAGFFNETRDDVFTRPSILLPAAYGDNQNLRDLIYGGSGGQVYGDIAVRNQDISLVGTVSANHHLTQAETALLVNLTYAGNEVPVDLRLVDSWNFQVMDSIDNGRWEFAYSHFFGRFLLRASYPVTPPLPVVGRIDAGLDFFSARYNGERLSLTAEYSLNPNDDNLTLGGFPVAADNKRVVGDSGYFQADYRLDSSWSVAARVDALFRDRDDRDGTRFAAQNPGLSRFSQFSYDYMAAAHWRYGNHWGVWGEYHWVVGTANLQALDNVGRKEADRWSILALMAGFTF